MFEVKMPNSGLRSPLAHVPDLANRTLSVDQKSCAMAENAFQGFINLRGNPSDAAFLSAVESVLGVALPLKANTVAVGANCTLYWLGPDEWLYKGVYSTVPTVVTQLKTALNGQHVAVVDVSSGYTTLSITGAGAAGLIARGCPLDLHPKAFAVGACAQTHIAKSAALIRPLQSDAFEVVVRRSFARYLVDWLCAASDN